METIDATKKVIAGNTTGRPNYYKKINNIVDKTSIAINQMNKDHKDEVTKIRAHLNIKANDIYYKNAVAKRSYAAGG